MTMPEKNSPRLLVISSLSDKPEVELFCRLAADGFDVHIMCDPSAPERKQLSDAGIHLETFSNKNDAKQRIRTVIDKINPSVIYAPRTTTLALTAHAIKDLDTALIGYRGTTGHMGLFDLGPRLTYKNPRIDRIVCVSDAVRNYLIQKRIPKEKLITIPKGHNVDWYRPCDKSQLTKLGIPDDAFTLSFCGHVRRIKGVRYLIKAVSLLPPELNVHLLLVGQMDDWTVRFALKQAAVRRLVHCTGHRTDAASLIGSCNAFAMPSLKREGLPRALIEAMAQGVPPIASRAGGIPEIVEDGISGLLCPPRNAKAIADAIIQLATNKARAAEIGCNARKRVEEKFNIDTTVERMKKLFIEAAS